jgi:DNA-binding NtrC family response regulator
MLSPGSDVSSGDKPGDTSQHSLTDTLPALSAVERQMIASALKRHSGQLDGAARALGLSRKGLYLKRQRLGL